MFTSVLAVLWEAGIAFSVSVCVSVYVSVCLHKHTEQVADWLSCLAGSTTI